MIKIKKNKLNIIYEDKYLIVINKVHNLLSVGTEREKEKTLYHQVLEYVKKKNKNNKIFIIHRLDRDTSGLVIIAKDEKIKRKMQDNWDDLVKKRGYVAVVEGLSDEKGTIKSWLKENKAFISYSSKPNDGKLAITHYERILHNSQYSFLEIKIDTGRKNQIRVHMQDISHPIIGDKKYGATKNPIRRMGLHANILEFIHPVTNQLICLETDIPNNFLSLFKN